MSTYADPTIVSISQNPKVQPGAALVLLAGILAVLVGGAFYAQTVVLNNKKKNTDQLIIQDKQKLEELKTVAADLNSYSSLARNLHSLFDNQQRWAAVLGSLQQHLYKKMKVTSLNAKDTGSIEMTGVTADFTQYANILTSLTDASASQYFSAVKPVSVTKVDKVGGSEINFSFTLTIAPSVLAGLKSPTPVIVTP